MRDLRYIVKRILIGVGIVLVLGFINSAKASALEWSDSDMHEILSFKVRSTDTNYSYVYYNSTQNRYYLRPYFNLNSYSYYIENATDLPYFICYHYTSYNGTDWATNVGTSSNENTYCAFTSVPLKYLWYGDYGGSSNERHWASTLNFSYGEFLVRYSSNAEVLSGDPRVISHTIGGNTYQMAYLSTANVRRNTIFGSNYDVLNIKDNSLYFEKNINYSVINNVPEIESLQPTKITTNNIVTSYIFRPKFTSFDTELYDYQYKVGRDSSTWLGITQNEQQIRINNNTDFYVRIKEKSSGDIIDARSMTITNIGRQNSNVDYDITFTGEYRTANDLNNNHSSMNSVIMEYQIAIDYIPKNSILKYQYQFITSGTCNDNNNWQDVPSSDNGTRTYVTNVNGTLCARILDPTDSDTQKKEATFLVNSIGKLAIDDNSSGVGGLFSDISNSINFAGPISDIINIPINLINTISTGLAGGLTCTDYPLGSLWGTNLVIPCVNIKQHLGNSLYTTIDLIIACVMIYYIIKMFGELYTNLLFMSKNPIHDLGKRGD